MGDPQKRATQYTPQVVTLIIDDSGSMQGGKAKQASEAVQDLVITMQSKNLGSGSYRFLLNIARFGDQPHPIVMAKAPGDVDLNILNFTGSSGQTNMAGALTWAADAVRQALEVCRGNPQYREHQAPNPLVVFFSDGANYPETSYPAANIEPAARQIKSIPHKDGNVDVVACGIGMERQDFPIMQAIASRPDLAANIDPDHLADYIAAVATSVLEGAGPEAIRDKATRL